MSHQQQQQSTPASNAVFDSLKQSRRNSQVQQYNYQLNEFTPQQVPSVPVTPATIPHTGAANMMTTPINTNPITVRHNSFTTNATSSNNNDANSVASRSTQNTNYNHHHHQQQQYQQGAQQQQAVSSSHSKQQQIQQQQQQQQLHTHHVRSLSSANSGSHHHQVVSSQSNSHHHHHSHGGESGQNNQHGNYNFQELETSFVPDVNEEVCRSFINSFFFRFYLIIRFSFLLFLLLLLQSLVHQVEQLSEIIDKEKMRRIKSRTFQHELEEYQLMDQQVSSALKNRSPVRGTVETRSRIFSPNVTMN
jgi:hypothetical protein